MDLLRFLLGLPARLLRGLFGLLALLLRPVFGNVSWSAPAWAPATGSAIKRRPLHFAGGLAGIVILAAAGWFGWHWYESRPKPVEPDRVTFQAPAPAVTNYETTPIAVYPLIVRFSRSAATIAAAGKPVSDGIVMQPKLAGQWSWDDDRTLRFVPAEDWPVGQHYEVRFDKTKVFAPHVLMEDDHFDFDTASFTATVVKGEFYQDPQDPLAKKTIVQVHFNYPVDPAQFEKRIALTMADARGKAGDRIKFTVTYDERKLNAFVHSEPLKLPRDNGAVRLDVDHGIASVRGGDGSKDKLSSVVQVPGLYSLKVNDVQATLVDNARYEPEQVLTVDLGGAVQGSDLAAVTRAWVLPKDKPGQPADSGDGEPQAYPWSVREVGDDLLRTATPLKLDLVPTENDNAELQSFRFNAEPGQRIYVRIAKGLKSFGGYVLGGADARVLQVPAYPQLLRFMSDGALLSMSGGKRISVVSRNVPGMKLVVGRVLPDQLQHLVSLNQGTYARPSLYGLTDDHIVERFEKKVAFPPADPGKAHYEGVDLGQYLAAGKRGVFLLKLSQYDPVKEKRREAARAKAAKAAAAEQAGGDADKAVASDDDSDDTADTTNTDADSEVGTDEDPSNDERLVVVTDLGVLAKQSLDGSQDVFVQSIHDGSPVAGATVSVVAQNGQTLLSESTSAEGQVHFPTLKGFEREKKPAMYVVRKGEDLSFLPIGGADRQLDYSRFDIGGEPNARSQGQLSAYLFSDRGIYRPGDLFHIGMVVRAASWTRSVTGIPLVAEIVDPRGVGVKQQMLSMDDSGFGELSYTPAETAPTGTWTVNLYIARDGKPGTQVGSTTVQVKEFQPDRMKVAARLSQQVGEGWVKPDQLKAVVDVENLFGTPAADRRVEGSLTLRPAYPAFASYHDYHFYDIRRAKEGYEEALADAKSDDKGHAEFALDLSKYGDSTYQLYFLAKAYEAEGGRSVAAATQTMVSANDWLVGYKAVDDLDYVKRDDARSVNLIAIDPTAKKIALDGLKLVIIERKYVSVLTKQDSGVYKYESKSKETVVHEEPLAIPATGKDVTLPTDKPGNFALVVKNSLGKEVNRVEYAVAGAGNVSRSLERNAELQLALSKKDYAPGEPVEIAIRAPYAGSGLITIERDKVYAHAWFHATDTSSVQHITVPADFEGNGYVNVQYIRDPSSDEIFMSPLSYGVVPFSVNRDARRNAIAVEAPTLVKPGDTVTFKLTSPAPTRAVVFAVDEGILQVARYKLGDPLDFFFRKRMLEVGTSQILDLILPDFEKLMALSAAPGGDADGGIGRQLNPFKRKRDKPVAYWSGIVDVDGSHELSWKVPDYFNGKLRVMAISVSPDKIGSFETATTVRGDFVLSPNVPTTVAPGDEIEVSVGVANNLTGLGGKEVPVAVQLQTGPELQVVGEAKQSLNLGEMREGVSMFRVRATDKLGSGNLTFVASYGGKSAKQSIDLSVRPASAFRTQFDAGRVDAHGKADVPGLRKLYDAYAKRDAAISSLPIVLAQGLSAYLVDFPHYCTEQVVSSAMPSLIFGKRPEFGKVIRPAMSPASTPVADPVASLLDTLHSRQNGQGGFGLWTSTPEANPFVSAYAMHYMLEARERGVAIPQDMLDAGNAYLRQLAGEDGEDSLDVLRQRAYAVYLLTRQGTVTTNYLAAVQGRLEQAYPKQWKDDLAAAWLAASYKLLHQDKEANQLIAGPQRLLVRKPKDAPYVYGYYYDSLIRDASVLYLLAKHFPDHATALPPEALENIVAPIARGNYNTLSSAMTVLALDAYATQTGADVTALGIGEVGANGAVKPIQSAVGVIQRGSWSTDAARLRFTNDSDHAAWYSVTQGGYDRTAPTTAIAQGMEIVREYTDASGKSLDKVAIGQEIDVHVRIRATGDAAVGDVAIVDLLPGGFEPVIVPPPAMDTSGVAPAASEDANASDDQASDSDSANDSDDTKTPPWRSPIGLDTSTWSPDYADVREDRVVIYGTATPDVREFVYRIKATNAGTFVVPPAYGESLYDRNVQARSVGGKTMTVERKP
ncbi:MAG TPA: alpha-2-macroglobulin [Luteibacter sp.]|nr:alpha-2-macroglobulin [Luteibacter sp.]